MNEQDKNGRKLSADEAKKRLALALLARYELEGAEAIAKRDDLTFNRELTLKQIEAMLGKEEADAARIRWSPEAEEESYRRARMGMEIGARLAAMDRALARFTNIWKWSAEQLAEMLRPTDGGAWAATPALTRRTADQADIAGESSPITPVVDYKDGRLFITLRFPEGVPNIPRSKGSIELYIDGTRVENFSVEPIEERGKKELDLKVPVDATYAERHGRMGCEVHCNPDKLSEFAVVLATSVEESGNVLDEAELRPEAITPYRINASHEPRRHAAATETDAIDNVGPAPKDELRGIGKGITPRPRLSVLDWLRESGRQYIALFDHQPSLNLAADATQFKELPLPNGDHLQMAWDKSSISLTPYRPSGETATLWVSVVSVDHARHTVSIIHSMPVAQHVERFERGIDVSQFMVVISSESLGERQ